MPNSANSHINEIDVDDGISGSGHNDSFADGHDNNPGRLVIKGENSTYFV